MKSKLTILILAIVPLLGGIVFIANWSKQTNIKTTKYTAGTPVFSDRCYTDELHPNILEGLQLIDLTRHFHYDITIEIDEPTTIYRLHSEVNNDQMFEGWELLNEKVKVDGKSSVFTDIYKMRMEPGKHVLPPGGPVAASPVLLDSEGGIKAYYVTNRLFPEGIMGSKTTLLLLISLYLNYVMFLIFLRIKSR